MSDCELGELLDRLNSIVIDRRRIGGVCDQAAWHSSLNMSLEATQLKALIESAVSSALAVQRENFEERLTTISQRINDVKITVPEVEAYKEIEVLPGRQCDEPLDIVKSLPDFDGKQECYVSWRQAAQTAYKIFEKHEGSSKHYQAVAIIRNKVKGPADMVLASFNTVLNFKAIISRLDFTYSDKRPIYLIEQELSTLRQGSLTLLQYYDEVEKKLTLLTNKTIMTYDKTIAASLNEKYRMDALRVFISGTKKPLCDVLFSARPSDLPSALALAQEVESNHERYLFASTYARNLEDKAQRFEGRQQHREKGTGGRAPVKDFYPSRSPHFNRSQGTNNKPPQKMEPVQPMEVDPSLRYRQSTQHQPNVPFRNWVPPHTNQNEANRQAAKRPNHGSARFTGPKQQRIDHLSAGQECEEYRDVANSEAAAVDDELSDSDQINFLTQTPCYLSSKGQLQGEKLNY